MAKSSVNSKVSNSGVDRISLLASSYSGSTIFGMLLGQDDRFSGFGDAYLPRGMSSLAVMCNCGAAIGECSFRSELRKGLLARDMPPEMVHSRDYAIPFKVVASRYGGTKVSQLYALLGRIIGYSRVYGSFLERENFLLNLIGQMSQYEFCIDGSKR